MDTAVASPMLLLISQTHDNPQNSMEVFTLTMLPLLHTCGHCPHGSYDRVDHIFFTPSEDARSVQPQSFLRPFLHKVNHESITHHQAPAQVSVPSSSAEMKWGRGEERRSERRINTTKTIGRTVIEHKASIVFNDNHLPSQYLPTLFSH